MGGKKKLFGSKALSDAQSRMAVAIASDVKSAGGGFFLVGIQHQGVPLAERLAKAVKRMAKITIPVGKLDISMYRDDVGLRSGLPLIKETDIPFAMEGASVILVDDVLSSGRTIRAALDALTDYGRPKRIKLAVMVDRGNVEFPIRADYVGVDIKDVPPEQKILVEFTEVDGADGIFVRDWK